MGWPVPLRDVITTALSQLPGVDFRFVRLHEYQELLEKIAERFLARGVRDLSKTWLWEYFHTPISGSYPEDSLAELEKRLSPDERYWFLASEEDGKYWVADGTGAGILAVLRETHHFEYYIVERKLSWLLCENHHQCLIEAAAKTVSS